MHYNIWQISGPLSSVHHKVHFDISKKQDLQIGVLNTTKSTATKLYFLLLSFGDWETPKKGKCYQEQSQHNIYTKIRIVKAIKICSTVRRCLLLLHTAYKLCELYCVSPGPLSGYPVMFCSVGQILSGQILCFQPEDLQGCSLSKENKSTAKPLKQSKQDSSCPEGDSLTVVAVIDSGAGSNLTPR